MSRGRCVTALVAASILSVALLASCSEDQRPHDAGPDPGRTVDKAALISAINTQLRVDPRHDTLRALIVLVNGKPVLEEYFDWPQNSYWDAGQVTTSVMSTLIGIAVGEGTLALDQTLGELLPGHRRDMRPDTARATLRELLMMTAGLAGEARDARPGFMSARDPVASLLHTAVDPPGRYFEYSNQGAHLLSALLTRATGMPVLDYARSRLFDPLGIATRPADVQVVTGSALEEHGSSEFAWPVDRAGLNVGWNYLKLRPADMARIGLLFLDAGEWKGRPLVPASWVGAATREESSDVFPDNSRNRASGFGYGWWTTEADSESAYFAAGSGGQLIEVVPSRSLVVVVASEAEYDSFGGSGVSPAALTFLVDDVIAPAFAP